MFKNLLGVLLSTGILYLVLNYIEPPKSWQEASVFQILIFFLPLLSFFTFLINLFLKYIPRSFIGGLGLMFLVVLQSVDQINLISVPLVLALTIICAKLFPKLRFRKIKPYRLTRNDKIPRISKLGGK